MSDELRQSIEVVLTLYSSQKGFMIEKQSINGKDVWVKVDPYHVQRDNTNIIPTEYFTATCYRNEPTGNAGDGKVLKEDGGDPMLFESPVQALSYAWKLLEKEA